MKVYLPQTQRIEDFLSTLEDVTSPGIIKTRAVIEVDCQDAGMAKFLAGIDPGENGNGKPKRRSKKAQPVQDIGDAFDN